MFKLMPWWVPHPAPSPGLSSRVKALLVGLLAGLVAFGFASVEAQTSVDHWLVLGPVTVPASLLVQDDTHASLDAVKLSLETRWPAAGDSFAWLDGRGYVWEPNAAAETGSLKLKPEGGRGLAFAITYVDVDRWSRSKLVVTTSGPRHIWFDGNEVTGDEVVLTRGRHWLLIGSLSPEQAAETWEVSARFEELTPPVEPRFSLDPRHPFGWDDLRRIREVTDIAVDPKGRRAAFVVRSEDKNMDRWVSHIEIREIGRGELVTELRLTSRASSPRWSRDGARLAFTTPTDVEKGKGLDLWAWTPGQGGGVRLLRNEPGLDDIQWSADGKWIYFTATANRRHEEADKEGVERLTEVWHRWSNWEDKAHLFALNVDERTTIQLLGDPEHSVEAPTLSPDGKRLVFNRNVRFPKRPFLRSEIWVLDMENFSTRKLLDLPKEAFGGPAAFAWSPDGRAIAFCASAKELLEGEETTFSVYETELYGTTVDLPQIKHLSAGFVPTVGGGLGCRQVRWNETDGRVYVAAGQGARTVLARTTGPVPQNLDGVRLEVISLPGEAMEAHDVQSGTLVAAVESPVNPQTIYRMDLAGGETTELFRPSDGALEQVAMPNWEPWNFTDSEGWEIEGWYLTPPDFNPAAKYPMIVYYYGGTSATRRSFDERRIWFASKGYVVYVLNPAGAPGYGQEFSNLHINDWGHPAATDIIEGVTQFVDSHPFVDRNRIGNYGRSYGGFMTMHLLTRTDLFAASVEVAGISNIAGYWGAGWTGYSYTDGTCPGCYPWNRPDVFVNRSPLFQADRIHTPLLLVHGTADTNVVPTESEQMFTALRVLDREAELVRFQGENHGIRSKPTVGRTLYTMMLQWFDKHLRDQPESWEARWGEDGVRKSTKSEQTTGLGSRTRR